MEFVKFNKIARLTRDCVITEKIDGTNSSICITEDGEFLIGSRTRWITPNNDNFGFARWATEHKEELMTLGVGIHYGEWWGSGIQRGYGLVKGNKRFSLFNVSRWCLHNEEPKVMSIDPKTKEPKLQQTLPECCSLVPVLWKGIFDTTKISQVLEELKIGGSKASPGFMKPEGIIIYHTAAGIMFKKTIEKDEIPKCLIREVEG